MKTYEATAIAYKNGYEKGYEDGKPKWIPVTERLPKEWDRVLVRTSANTTNVARLVDKEWRVTWNLERIDCVVHWMPLPEPPKEV